MTFLRRAVDLAAQALEAGDEPFGSVLVSAEGDVLFEDHNHVVTGDDTRHPEFEIARWAAEHLSPRSAPPRPSTPPASTARCARPRTAGSGSAGS